MSRILVVDDDPDIRETLVANLEVRGHLVASAADGESALAEAGAVPPDLVILDLGLPGLDGIEVLRRLRGWYSGSVLVLSARDREADKVEALDAGADDYVAKPFGMDELLARTRAALRRSTGPDEDPVIRTADFEIDLAGKRVRRLGEEIRLTPTEWGIIEELARNRGRLVGRTQLLQAVWGPSYSRESHYLRVYMTGLRRKLEPIPSQPRYLITEPGMGYRFMVGD